ncbi:MAG: homoserine dehydrogenase [Proteobacteria bacterium]|nr:homoserine dehydrogenase [Pseudomonadota bacterium]MDA1059669.1 homoserine dehydrogenase [Pseudomonadota bacterium]
MSDILRIGIAGLGTVGAGTLALLRDNADILRSRCGKTLTVVAVSARDRAKDRGVDLNNLKWYDDPRALAEDPNVDVVVELIGGDSGPALALVTATLVAGKPVVTANKALIALHGTALAALAEKSGVALSFEAAVAGGIPIIKALRESFAANRTSRVYGILNGTCNYILTTMESTGAEFDDVLAEAQALGYAEADPSFDVDGIDTAHKLAILSSVAFGAPVDFAAVYTAGIRNVTATDIRHASELGFRIKLLGIATIGEEGIAQRVHPCMVPVSSPMAHVDGAFNAVLVDGDFVGRTIFEGPGAGAGPTASAVVADLVDIAREWRVPPFGVASSALVARPSIPIEDRYGAYYLRLNVLDQSGVLADIAAHLRDHDVSIESVLQRGRDPGERVSVIMTTHETYEAGLAQALAGISESGAVVDPPCMIRIENL